jgi:hypothetical protein
LELAEKIARRANDDSKGTNAEVLDTLARALFRRGDKAEAVRMQEKAAQLAKGKRQTNSKRPSPVTKRQTSTSLLIGTIKPGLSVRGWPEARGISNLIQT